MQSSKLWLQGCSMNLEPQQHKKNVQSEMTDTLIEIKNKSKRINSRVDETENQISNFEYKESKNTQSEQQEEKKN